MNVKYTAYTQQKTIIKGTISVPDIDTAVQTLERAGYQILSLKKTRTIRIEDILPSLFSVKKVDVVLFSRQLAMLMEKGVRFIPAIKLAKDQVKNRLFRRKLEDIIADVESGTTFSDAVAKYPEIFPATYHSMMKVGEKSGNLESVLHEVAEDIENDEASRKRIRNAFIYPGVIFFMGIITVVVMITTVLPSMVDLYSRFSSELPLPTRITLSMADFLIDYGLYILLGIVLIVIGLVWYSRTASGKYYIEKTILALPVIGNIIMLRNLHQFSRISTILLGAGLPVLDVILNAQQGVQSESIRRELRKIPGNLMQGYGLSRSMRESSLFPSMLVQMVITGEETNTLESSFDALSEHYEFEFNQSLSTFMSLLEPVLILVIGLFIGFIAISAMMPVYSIYDVMS